MSEKNHLHTLREYAVRQGRAMVRVRSLADRERATIGVCPACFNTKKRREVLLLKLAKLGYEVVYRDDRLDGVYRPGRGHAPGCRYAHLSSDPWDEFSGLLSKLKRNKTT